MKTYDFVFISPLPAIISIPAGGMNIIYKLSGYLASKKYRVAIVYLKNYYRIPKKLIESREEEEKLLSYNKPEAVSFFIIKLTEFLFSNKRVFGIYQKLIGNDYDYTVLKNVDIKFTDEGTSTKIKARRIFATAWQTAFFVEDYLKENPNAKGFYLIQNFEDNKTFTGKYSAFAKKTYDFRNLKKIVICKGLYDRFVKDNPLRFNVAVDDMFKVKTDPEKRNPYTILMPLRMGESKGAKYALEAAKRLRRGSGKYEFMAYGNMSKEVVPDYITYYYKPSNKELCDIYNKAAIFIYPSLIEGFGSPPIEAMASGCATVIADSVGVKEYARDNHNCLIVPIRNSAAMSKAIKKLVDHEKLKKRFVKEGIKTAKRFSYASMYESFIALFGESTRVS